MHEGVLIMPHRGATNAVIRNLMVDTGIWDSPGDRFAVQPFEPFVADAKSWLGDRTRLKTSTIESADWPQVYEYFREGN